MDIPMLDADEVTVASRLYSEGFKTLRKAWQGKRDLNLYLIITSM